MSDEIEVENLQKEVSILRLELEETKQQLRAEMFKLSCATATQAETDISMKSLSDALDRAEKTSSTLRTQVSELEEEIRCLRSASLVPVEASPSELEMLKLELDRLRAGSMFLNFNFDDETVKNYFSNVGQSETQESGSPKSSLISDPPVKRLKEIENLTHREIVHKMKSEIMFKNALIKELQGKLKETQEQAHSTSSALLLLRRELSVHTKGTRSQMRTACIEMMEKFAAKQRESYGLLMKIMDSAGDNRALQEELVRLEKGLNDCITSFGDLKEGLFSE